MAKSRLDEPVNVRMEAILQYVRGDRPLFDLCCDHGLLGLAAHARGNLPQLTFVDQSPAVMRRLTEHLATMAMPSLSKIEQLTLAAEDLQVPEEPSDFIIAGVGGHTIIKIIDRLFPQGLGQHRLILASQQKTQELRFHLRARGFALVDERVVLEKGRFREVLVLEAQGEAVTLYGERYRQRSDAVSQAFVLFLQNYYAKIQEQKTRAGLTRKASSV